MISVSRIQQPITESHVLQRTMKMKDTAVSILITPVVLVVMIILAPIFAVALICSGIMAVFVVPVREIVRYMRIRRTLRGR